MSAYTPTCGDVFPFPFGKCRNPDPRCCYPWTNDGVGYCWSYAHHVDGSSGFEDLSKTCPNCDCWCNPYG